MAIPYDVHKIFRVATLFALLFSIYSCFTVIIFYAPVHDVIANTDPFFGRIVFLLVADILISTVLWVLYMFKGAGMKLKIILAALFIFAFIATILFQTALHDPIVSEHNFRVASGQYRYLTPMQPANTIGIYLALALGTLTLILPGKPANRAEATPVEPQLLAYADYLRRTSAAPEVSEMTDLELREFVSAMSREYNVKKRKAKASATGIQIFGLIGSFLLLPVLWALLAVIGIRLSGSFLPLAWLVSSGVGLWITYRVASERTAQAGKQVNEAFRQRGLDPERLQTSS